LDHGSEHQHSHTDEATEKAEQPPAESDGPFDNELLGIFYGISNISMFVGSGMGTS